MLIVPLILVLVSGLSMAACQTLPPTVTPAPASESVAGPTTDPSAEAITVDLTNSELALGMERLAFRMYDASGAEILGTGYTVETVIYRTDPQTGSYVKVASGNALYFGLGVPDGGAWVVYTEFDSSGPWALEVIVRRADGWTGRMRRDFTVAGRTLTPRVGDLPPSLDTPAASGDDLSAVTSDPSPDPELYSLTLAAATTSGRPTVIHFGSPGHCTTPVCGPTLDEVKSVKAQYASQVNFIHVETRDLTDPSKLSSTASAWGLPSEPWTFVLNGQGRVTARVEGPLDRSELGLLVKQVLGTG